MTARERVVVDVVVGRVRCMPQGGSVCQWCVGLFFGRHPGLDPGFFSIAGFRLEWCDGHGAGMLKQVQHDGAGAGVGGCW